MWEQRRVVIGGSPKTRNWGENRRGYYSGARRPSSRPLSRDVAVLKVGCPWMVSGRESGRECLTSFEEVIIAIYGPMIYTAPT